MATIITTFQFKRGLASAWTTVNPVLQPAEPGYELDTGKLKIGNGINSWNDLPYLSGESISEEQVNAIVEFDLGEYNTTINHLTLDVDAGTTWADIVSNIKFNPLIDITINGETKYMRLFKIMYGEVYSLNWFAFDPDSGGEDGYFPLKAVSVEEDEDGNHPFEYVSPSDQIQSQDTIIYYGAFGD